MKVSTPEKDYAESHTPEHRDVSGGWLRPAVFGAMDGLVTNVSLISGVGGGGGSKHVILLTGLAGLAAGAFSMAAGEFVSVSSQNELVQAEVDKERHELTHNAAAEQVELVGMLRAPRHQRGHRAAGRRGDLRAPGKGARRARHRGTRRQPGRAALALRGRRPRRLSRSRSAPSSRCCPTLLGFDALWAALGLSALAAVIGGGLVSRLTDRPFWRGAVRQLVLGALAAGITYLIGLAVGGIAAG